MAGAQAIIDRFLQLIDVDPSSYSGQGGKTVKVKSAEDGLEFGAAGGSVVLIEEKILLSDVASVTFTSIPQIYRHLVLFQSVRITTAAELSLTAWRVNGDAGANYDNQQLQWTGAPVVQAINNRAVTSVNYAMTEAANSRANAFSPCVLHFIDYANTAREKFAVSGVSSAFGNVSAQADLVSRLTSGRWRNIAAITSLESLAGGDLLATGSRFALYGIL